MLQFWMDELNEMKSGNVYDHFSLHLILGDYNWTVICECQYL